MNVKDTSMGARSVPVSGNIFLNDAMFCEYRND